MDLSNLVGCVATPPKSMERSKAAIHRHGRFAYAFQITVNGLENGKGSSIKQGIHGD